MSRERRAAIHAIHDVVLVPLANSAEYVTIDRSDFDCLMALGFSDQWTLNGPTYGPRYVRCYFGQATGQLLGIARLVMQPAPGEIVKYRDGNRLNLRRSNLYVTFGRSKGRELAAVEQLTQPIAVAAE